MNKLENLPLYKAILTNEDDGIYVVSFVEYPATELQWQYYGEEKKPLKFSVEDEEKHIVTGVIMVADTPIYRIGISGYEYCIEFPKDVLREMSQRYLANGFSNNVDTNHNHQLQDGIYMQEIYIKDVANGINPKGFENVTDGSLFGKYKVENEEVWQKIKSGEFNGFSIEVINDIVEVQDPEELEFQECVELLNKINKRIKENK